MKGLFHPRRAMPMVPPVSFDKLVTGFLNAKQFAEGCSVRTVEAYADILKRFEVFLEGRDVRTLSEQDLIVFVGLYVSKQFGLHARSRVPYVACIRGFFAWLAECGVTPDNLAEKVEYPRAGRPLPAMLSQASAEKMLAQPDYNTFEGVRDGAILSLFIGCGIRLAGLVALNRSSIRRYQHKNEARLALRVMEKGDRERMIPIPREAELMLTVYLEHPDYQAAETSLPDGDQVLFVNLNNRRCPAHEWHGERRRFSRRGVQRMFERYADAAGVPRDEAHPHAARHLFGTELTEDDTPLHVTGALMGHAAPKSTEIYTHLALRKTTDVIDKANPLAKIKSPAQSLLRQLGHKP